MHLTVIAEVFPIIFVGELPDKTMFASVLLSSRGHPRMVWLGAAGAFLVHTAIAVAAGGLLSLIPHRVLDVIVAVMFLLGAWLALRESGTKEEQEGEAAAKAVSPRGAAVTAFVVIFLAEWGDLTQVLIATFAARYQDPTSVGVGALLGLWSVAALAVLLGRQLARVPVTLFRRITAGVLVALAGLAVASAATGVSIP